MHADETEAQGMPVGEPTLAHERADHGDLHEFGQACELAAGIRGDDAPSCVEDGPFG